MITEPKIDFRAPPLSPQDVRIKAEHVMSVFRAADQQAKLRERMCMWLGTLSLCAVAGLITMASPLAPEWAYAVSQSPLYFLFICMLIVSV